MCAAPTDPTLVSICTEGLKKAGYSAPATNPGLTRSQDEYIPEIKNDIWIKEKKLKSLYFVKTIVLTEGKSRYAMPTDYASDLSLVLMTGEETGTAQAGTTSSITFASDEGLTEANAVGKEVLITSGTGQGSFSQIDTYNTSTKKATVTPNFDTAPDATSGYMVIDDYSDLDKTAIRVLDEDSNPTETGKPVEWFPTKDDDSGELTLQPVPDDTTYGLRFRYYANLMTLDLTGNLMALLYRKWQSLWKQGVFYKQLQSDDDSRQTKEEKVYWAMLIEVMLEEVTDLGADSMTIKPNKRRSL